MKRTLFVWLLILLPAVLLSACSSEDGGIGFGAGSNGVKRQSAAWVSELGTQVHAKQLFVVAGVGPDTAYISMHEKDARGNWVEIMTTPGFVRKDTRGMSVGGDDVPTVGVYALNASGSLADDPGCVFYYKIVAPNEYLSGAGVSIPEACLHTVIQKARRDCVVVIDALSVLSPETYTSLFGTGASYFAHSYVPAGSVEVDGRQGVCSEGEYYWVSGSSVLAKYDREWNLLEINKNPFEELEERVNHIGDIDVYKNELYTVAEYFTGAVGKNMQIVIYDGDTLEYKRSFPVDEESGMTECSGIAVNPDHRTLWLCSWAEGDSGKYLYQYDMDSGEYHGKTEMVTPPAWIQGIAYYDGSFYLTADDGEADMNEPDHLYRATVEYRKDTCVVMPERVFDDVTRQGEIEGLSFDRERKQLLLLYNRGIRIVQGRSRGFYNGYTKEISEVFLYDMQ